MRAPRRTARLRLTILHGGVCLVFDAILLAVTYLLTWGAISTNLHAHPVSVSGQGTASPADPQQSQDRLQSGVEQQITLDRQLLLTRSGLALVIVSVTAVGAGWLMAGRVLRPLSTITTAARRISASSLDERLALQGPDDELKELGDTLDQLFARLEASFGAQRRFAANASRELRTPLTRERTLLQVALADPASTADTWQAVSKELLASNAETERLRLNVRTNLKPAILQGDPLLIQQLVTNLIDNAVRHNIPGGDVRVATATSGGRAVLSVINSGQVIPPAEVDRLFQPFQRLGPRRARRDGGHGLGLSIVGAIATSHRATITPRSGPGGGLAIAVAFLGGLSGNRSCI